VQNAGIRTAAPDVMQKLLAGQAVDPKLVYFRTQPKFETSAPGLQWLAKSLFVGVGERYPEEVVIRFLKSNNHGVVYRRRVTSRAIPSRFRIASWTSGHVQHLERAGGPSLFDDGFQRIGS
jgi:hypothetical protein